EWRRRRWRSTRDRTPAESRWCVRRGLRLQPLPRWRHRPRAPRAPPSSDDPVDAALLERASDDQPLDLGRALPDAIHPELAEEALRRGLALVSATAEDLDDPVGAPERRFGREQLGERRLGMDDLGVGL